MDTEIAESGITIADLLSSPIKNGFELYYWVFKFADPRVDSWPLMSSPIPTIIIVATYLAIANFGPKYMEKREPLKLKWSLVFYNMFITILNGWMALELCWCAYQRSYNLMCQLVDVSNNEYEVRIAKVVWWYYASKCMEFMDTFFFIMRKKTNQLSFLHIYHHSTMFCVWWAGARFVPGGSVLGAVMVNCFVHVLMYSYYALAAFGPRVQKYLWWKKYLTMIQLVQFAAGVSLGIYVLASGCQFTRWTLYVFVGYALSFLLLFSDFYKNAYMLRGDGRRPEDKKQPPVTIENKQSTPSKQKHSHNANNKQNNPLADGLTQRKQQLANGNSPKATNNQAKLI